MKVLKTEGAEIWELPIAAHTLGPPGSGQFSSVARRPHPQAATAIYPGAAPSHKEKNNPHIHSFRRKASPSAVVFSSLSQPPKGATKKEREYAFDGRDL